MCEYNTTLIQEQSRLKGQKDKDSNEQPVKSSVKIVYEWAGVT